MRPVFLVPLLLVLGIACTFSKNKKNSYSGEKTNNTVDLGTSQFEFTEELHNFGKLTSGERVIHTFRFRNTGSGNLMIEKVTADCGCINVKFGQKTVIPGSEGMIEAEFNTSGLYGKQLKAIVVFANIPEKKKILFIGAEVTNETIDISDRNLKKGTEK
jgi:hypothetical protein